MAWAERNDESFLFFVVVFVELRRVAKTQNLPCSVAGEDAMRSLGLERDHSHIPRTSPVGRRYAPARHAFERFELENGAVGLTELVDAAGTAIRTSPRQPPGAADVRRPPLQSRDQLFG